MKYIKKILLILLCFSLTGCIFYNKYKMPKDAYIKLNKNKINIYSNTKIKDLIKSTNTKILNKNNKINTNKIRKYDIEIKYEFNKKKYILKTNYEISDTEKPTLLYAPKSYTYYVSDKIDNLCKNTSTIDNYDREITCKINKKIDSSKEGSYNLKYIFSDDYNNKLEENFNLNIISNNRVNNNSSNEDYYEPNENNTSDGIKFSDIKKNYKNKNTMIGIDVSRWQGNIDFKKIKESGCEFVIIRMAVSNSKKDKIGLDTKFKRNIKAAKKEGLKVRVYVYTAASSIDEVKEQAKFVRKNLKNVKLDFPIAYDFEDWNNINILKINKNDLTRYVDEFYKIVNKDNYDVMIYGSKFYLENVWNEKNYPVWLAHYNNETSYKGKYIMWQIASDGLIDGIDGYVDMDIYYKKK